MLRMWKRYLHDKTYVGNLGSLSTYTSTATSWIVNIKKHQPEVVWYIHFDTNIESLGSSLSSTMHRRVKMKVVFMLDMETQSLHVNTFWCKSGHRTATRSHLPPQLGIVITIHWATKPQVRTTAIVYSRLQPGIVITIQLATNNAFVNA